MRTLAIACACVLLVGTTASAGDVAVSKSTLDSMGLGTMQPLPDQAGALVRGKFTAAGVWGGSIANWNGQSASNSYFASSSWLGSNGSSAFGNSVSFGSNFQFGQFSF
jgi:hypothetical protein